MKLLQNPHVLLTFDEVRKKPSVFYTFDLEMCFAPQRRTLFRHLNIKKWSEPISCSLLFTWKCASRHNGVHVCDISTSKSGPNMWWFLHFDLDMCPAPHRRALFQHLNFQKWSGREVFLVFYFQKCFAPQGRALFRHLNFQKRSELYLFYFQKCFAPQRRALFRHLNFQKWSELYLF